jgi:hypothetical protein
MYFRYVRTIQNQNPVQSSNSLPRKNKVKKASHEKNVCESGTRDSPAVPCAKTVFIQLLIWTDPKFSQN